MKRPDDYRPDNPAAAEGVNHVRTFGTDWPLKQKDEPPMITLDTLRAEVARGICPQASMTMGDLCQRTGVCAFVREGSAAECAPMKAASAAIAIVLRAVADGLAIRRDGYSGDDTAAFGARVALHVASHDIEALALAAGGGR